MIGSILFRFGRVRRCARARVVHHDQFGSGELGGLTTVPLMTGGSADHALAVEVHLRPVLVEIGASCPTRGLFVFGPAVDDPTPTIDAWWEAAAPLLGRN